MPSNANDETIDRLLRTGYYMLDSLRRSGATTMAQIDRARKNIAESRELLRRADGLLAATLRKQL